MVTGLGGLRAVGRTVARAGGVVSLIGNALVAGDHTVEVVQFVGDDTAGTATFFRNVVYTAVN